MTAFLEFKDATCLQHCPPVNLMPFSMTSAVTSGIASLIGKSRASSTSRSSALTSGQTLPDGRMKVGVDLPLLSRRFRYLRLLGEGMSAQVILAEDTHSQNFKVVVIKVLKRHFSNVGQKEACALRFLQARNMASHAGFVKLSSAFTYRGHVCLVLERLYGNLLDYVVHSASLPKAQALQNLRKIAMQLLGSLALMHSKGIVHADIKPENILMSNPADTSGVGLKLIDLGNCFSVTGTDTSRISFEMQSLPFRAPEAVLGCACGTGIDVWSLGCLLAEVALQRPLFPIATTSELVHQMTMQLGPFPRALTAHSDPCTGPHGLPSQGSGPQAPCPADQQAPRSQQARDSTSRQHQPAQQKSFAGSLSIQKGKLDLLHEVACPLHLDLAKVDPFLASLVMTMLRYDPEQRVSAAEALQHPFLSELTPMLQLLAANREADDKAQGRAMGSTVTLAQGVSQQQGCQAEAVSLDQAAGTLHPERKYSLPFKPAPRRQAIVSLPTGGHLTAQAAVPTWAAGRLPMPSDPLLPACQPQLQAAQPQLQAAQPQLQAAQPWLQAAQPQVQTAQPQRQPEHSTYAPPLVQRPVMFSPNRTAGMTAAELVTPATASATPQPPAAAAATDQHNLDEVAAHHSRGVQLPAALPAVLPSLGPSPHQAVPLLASYGVGNCTLPAQDADPPSPPLAAAASPLPAQQAEAPSPSLPLVTCPLPAQQADLPSGLLTVGSSPTTAVLTTIPRHPDHHRAPGDGRGANPLWQDSPRGGRNGGGLQDLALGSGQGRYPAGGPVDTSKGHVVEQAAGAEAVGTPMALGQGPVKTPGLVKAWNGVTELLLQMSPGSQVKPAPRRLTQALQAAKPSATPPHTTASPPHAKPPLLSPPPAPRHTQQGSLQQLTNQSQQEKKLPALQKQPKQHQKQQQEKKEPLLQNHAKNLQADHTAVSSASEPMSHARYCAVAMQSDAQQAGLNPGKGSRTEAGKDMPFSQQSHVSASPSKSKSDRQATSQQQLQHTLTIADSVARSSHETVASRRCSDSKPDIDQPVLLESANLADTADEAGCQAALADGFTAQVQERKADKRLTSSGALLAALEPAGPVARAQSEGHGLPAPIDKLEQLPWQLAKHVSRDVGQKRKSPHAPGTEALGQRTRLHNTDGTAAEQKSRNVSPQASTAPAESQQSAVHALLPAPPHQSMPVKQSALKRSMPAAEGQVASDVRTVSSKAKRLRGEVAVGLAGMKHVEQTRKRGRAHLGTMPLTSSISLLGNQATQSVGAGSPQILSRTASELPSGEGGLCEGAAEEDSPERWLLHAPLQEQIVTAQSSSMEHQPKGCDRIGQSGKRPLRKRDSDANKPWWVV